MKWRRPGIFRNHRVEALAGGLLMLAGGLLLKDAYEGRGIEQPRFLRPFTFL